MDQNLQGKVALVTGATSGLGLEASAGLAARGMKVIFAVRNAKKAEKVASEIRAKVPQAKLLYPPEVPTVDFQDNDSIRAYVKAILERNEPLAILINNAGTSKLPNENTKDGVASLAQANYLGPWLLTHLLEPLLVSSKSRVVFVSSMTARSCVITDPHTFLTSWWHSWYKHTKLAECFNAFELQRRLGAQGVTVAALDPGGVNTAIWTNTVFSSFPIKQLIQELYAPAEEAAEIIIHAATVPWEVDAEPGVPPEEDLRFYARGLCASPLLCNVDGSWSTWTSTPKWGIWGASAIMHTMLDYPLRHRSGRRLCARIQRVPGPHQAYDKNLAKELWSLSEKFTGSTSTPMASPQQLPQETAAPMSKGKDLAAGATRQDMEPSTAAAGAAELAGDAVAEVLAVPFGAAGSKPVAKSDAQGRGEGQGQGQEREGRGMGQGVPHSAFYGTVRPAVQVGPPGPNTGPETSTATATTKAVPSPDESRLQAAEGGLTSTGKAVHAQAAGPGSGRQVGEITLITDIIDRSAAPEIQPVAGDSITLATFEDADEPSAGAEPATAVEAKETVAPDIETPVGQTLGAHAGESPSGALSAAPKQPAAAAQLQSAAPEQSPTPAAVESEPAAPKPPPSATAVGSEPAAGHEKSAVPPGAAAGEATTAAVGAETVPPLQQAAPGPEPLVQEKAAEPATGKKTGPAGPAEKTTKKDRTAEVPEAVAHHTAAVQESKPGASTDDSAHTNGAAAHRAPYTLHAGGKPQQATSSAAAAAAAADSTSATVREQQGPVSSAVPPTGPQQKQSSTVVSNQETSPATASAGLSATQQPQAAAGAAAQPAQAGAPSAGRPAGSQQQGSKTTTSGSTGGSSKNKGKGKKK